MPRHRPTQKLAVYGKYDLNPEQAVTQVVESKLQNKHYVKTPNWDVSRLGFELRGIQSNREHEEVTQEHSHQRSHSDKQFLQNERHLAEADILLKTLWDDFVEVNDFVKDCEMKENEAYETIETEKRKQGDLREKIDGLNTDLAVLNEFVDKYEGVVNGYEMFEVVLDEGVKQSETFDSVEDLMIRCDSLLLAQVEIAQIEKEKIAEIEHVKEDLMEFTKQALKIITGLNNDLSELRGRYVSAREDCLKNEASITAAKNYMAVNEMRTDCMLDAITHLYNMICSRCEEEPKFDRGDVEKQLDYIKEETSIMREILSISKRRLAKMI